jgi:hypothetical protein
MVLKAEKIERARPFSLLEEKKVLDDYEKAQDSVTFAKATSAAFAEDNAMSWVFNQLEEYEIDPEFSLNDDEFNELTKDIPLEYQDFVGDARSMSHGRKLRANVLNSLENEKTLAKYGWASLPLRIAAATIDPVAIGATVLSEGVLAPAIWTTKATRLGRFFRGGLTAGATSAAIEAYLVSQNQIKDPYDILYAAGGGMILGGATSSIFGKASTQNYEKAGAKFANDASKAQASDVAQSMKDNGIEGVGAMQNPMSEISQVSNLSRGAEDRIEDAQGAAMATMGKIRFDMIGQLKSSKVGSVRALADILGEDAVDPGQITADLIKTVETKATTTRFTRVYDDSYTKWAKSLSINYIGREFGKSKKDFGVLVADEIELPGSTTNPHIVNAANAFRKEMATMLNKAKKANVRGYDDIPENPTYFAHLWDASKFREIRSKYKNKNLIPELLTNALSRANPNMDSDIAKAIGEGMYRNIVNRSMGMDAGLSRMFSTSQREVLKEVLEEEELLSNAQIESLLNQIHTKPEKGLPRTRRRLNFDIETTIETEGQVVSIKDLMNRDTEEVFNVYVNQVVGRTALARKGIVSDSDFEKRLRDISEEGDNKNIDVTQDKEKLNVLYQLISGRPSPKIADPSAFGNRLARLLLDYSFIRVMNQVGFAQVAELGNAVSIDGVTGLLRVLPEFKSMLKRVRNGEIEDSVINDIEAFTGIGADRLIHNAVNKYDPEDMLAKGRGGFLSNIVDKGLNVVQPLKRITADISLMAQVTLALERAAARIATQQLVDLSFGIKSINFARLGKGTRQQDIARRMKSLGLDDAMSQRVFDQIRENAVLAPSGFFGNSRKVRRINLEQWADEDARDAFIFAISRWTRQSIQQNDVGNLNIHMTSTLGKILTQFRTFMLVSYSKQFLHNIHRRDFAAFQGMMYSVLFGGLAYTLQTHVNSIGRNDKESFLEERLSITEIGKAAFQRAGWASLFPALVDTGASLMGEDPLFAYGRTTGLASNIIRGIPLVDLVDNASKAFIGGSRYVFNDEYQWSRGQQRALNSLVPFQNAMGIKNVLNKTLEGLPTNANLQY